MSLSQDLARCAGYTEGGGHAVQLLPLGEMAQQCEDCQRRTSPAGEWTPHMQPYRSAAFGCCPFFIAPAHKPCA